MYHRGWKLTLLSAVVSFFPVVASATVYDLTTSSGCQSLSDIVKAVSTQQAVGACEAGTGNDRIVLAQNKTYVLEAPLVLGGEVKETTNEEGEVSYRHLNGLTLRIDVATESGQTKEERGLATIQAPANDRAFWVHANNSLVLEHIRVKGGDVREKPLEVKWQRETRHQEEGEPVESHRFEGLAEAPFGGIAFVQGAFSTRGKAELLGGKAHQGGAVYFAGRGLELNDAKLLENQAEAVSFTGINHCVISPQLTCDQTNAPDEWEALEAAFTEVSAGGAVFLYDGRFNLNRSHFEHNQAPFGGAVAASARYNGEWVAEGVYFAHNHATEGAGGALYMAPAQDQGRPRYTLVNTLLHKNHAQQGGAALHVDDINEGSELWLNNITVFHNTVAGEGAGLWVQQPLPNAVILNSVLLANESGAYKRANKYDFKEGSITGCWLLTEDTDEDALENTFCYAFEKTGEPFEYERESHLVDDEGKPWLRLADQLIYIGREGEEWRTLAEVADAVAEPWYEAWQETLPRFENASLKVEKSEEEDNPSFTVRFNNSALFTLNENGLAAADGAELNAVLVFNATPELAAETQLITVMEEGGIADFLAPFSLIELPLKAANSRNELQWRNGSITLSHGEYALDEHGNLCKEEACTTPLYLTPEKTVVESSSPSGNEPTLNNISQLGYLNDFLQFPGSGVAYSYVWHGNVEPEGEPVLNKEEQLALLRGAGEGANTVTCDEQCTPIVKDNSLPYFTVNFEPVRDGFSLLGSGAPYVGSSELNVCEPKDMRGITRQDRCDAGAVDFQRALGEKDTFHIAIGATKVLDVLANDVGDSQVDCRRIEGAMEAPEKCLSVVIASTREQVKIRTVVDENGYPQIEYDSGEGFHGHDYFEYRTNKDAFPENTTLGGNDVGARVAVVSEPNSGIASERLSGGVAHGVWLLALMLLGALRRGGFGKLVVAAAALVLANGVHANEVEVSTQGLVETSTQFPTDICTLRAAIASTEAPPTNTACKQGSSGVSRDVIVLPEGTIELIDTLKVNTNNPIEIRGQGPDKTTITLRETDEAGEALCKRLFETESALTLTNLTLKGGCVTPDSEKRGGAALYAYAKGNNVPPSVGMHNVHVVGNRALEGAWGGAIFLAYRGDNRSEATFDSVYFENNSAEKGAAIFLDGAAVSNATVNVLNSTFHKNEAKDGGDAIASAAGQRVKLNVVNSLFYENPGTALDLSDHAGTVNLLNSTWLNNGTALKLSERITRLALHNSVVGDEVSGALADAKDMQLGFNLLPPALDCEPADGTLCALAANGNNFNEDVAALHAQALSVAEACPEGAEDCVQRWFVPYLEVLERHDDEAPACVVENDEGETEAAHCIVEQGNPAPLQTGVSAVANCRTTDIRGFTREAGGRCDKGAYEKQINTGRPDTGNNKGRKSRTALLDVLRNDIPGDSMWIRPGTLQAHPIDSNSFVYTDENGQSQSVDEEALKEALEEHFGKRSEKLTKFFERGSTRGELVVVKESVPIPGLGDDPVPQYYDEITIKNEDGREDVQHTSRAWEEHFQCDGEDPDEYCFIYYEAPKNYLCTDLPFEDYFAYSVEAWRYDPTKPLEDGETPEFEGQAAEQVFTGYVQVTIDNIPPIVPREPIKVKIDPGSETTIDLKQAGVKPIEGGVSEDRPIAIEQLLVENEPQFALRDGRTHEVLGTGLFLNADNLTVTYRHGDVTKTFADSFSVKVVDSCGASAIVPIRVEFNGAGSSGGTQPLGVTLILVLAGLVRRKRLFKA